MPRNLLIRVSVIACALSFAFCALGQGPQCTSNITFNPPVVTVPAGGGSGAVLVVTDPSCTSSGVPTWKMITSKPWIMATVCNCILGPGIGVISYTILPNTTGLPVTGLITVSGSTTASVQILVKGSLAPVFSDVPVSHPQFDYIELVREFGLTQGCSLSPPSYCPDAPATRGQAAAFIIRSLLRESFAHSQLPYFTDVPPTHPQFAYIQKMWELNLTQGCSVNPAMFCPDQPIPRDQMAALLIRAKGQTAAPYSTTPYFTDVTATGSSFFGQVQKIREDGITTGCSTTPSMYCPSQAVTRAQLAVFVVRAFFTN